jgi:CMP-N-acetylneuraminic acid synthetase
MVKVLSVVCARAGSKGLNNKCVAKINHKMVVEHAIEYSLSLGSNVETVVSTDIESLIEYCKKEHITYIKRVPKFCADESKIDDALADAIESNGQDCEYCSLVYGNIPTRYPDLFYEALNFLQENKDYDAVISMQNVEKFHPEWMFDYNEKVLPLVEESHYRRQSLSQKMIHDGHTLIFNKDKFFRKYRGKLPYDKKKRYSIFGAKFKPLINDEVIVDIDTKKDLILADALLNNRSKHYKS